MRRSRFAKLMITGKTATLPLLVGQSRADVTPTYSDMIGSDLRVIEVPVSSAVRLQSIAADAGATATSAYAGSSYAANLCTNASLPASTTIVVTGVNVGDNVILAAARTKNDPLHLALDSRLTVGRDGLTILGSGQLGSGFYTPAPNTSMRGTMSFSLQTSTLTALATTGKVYVQAAVLPANVTGGQVNLWRFSELDEIQVGTCATSSYGTY